MSLPRVELPPQDGPQSDLSQERVALLRDVRDARLAGLNNWFGPSMIYVDTIETIDENHGIGRMIVTPERIDHSTDPSFKGGIVEIDEGHIVTRIRTIDEHAKDHFKDGLVKIVAGSTRFLFAQGAIEQMHEAITGKPTAMQLDSFDSVRFAKEIDSARVPKPLMPNEDIEIEFVLDGNATIEQPKGTVHIRRVANREDVFIAQGFATSPTNDSSARLQERQKIESWVQSLGMIAIETGSIPFFESIGRTEFYRIADPEKELTNFVEITKRLLRRKDASLEGLTGNVYSWSGEDIVGKSMNLEGKVFTEKQALRMLRQAA